MTSKAPGNRHEPEGPTRHGALFELTRFRLVAFLREPEAVFWVFVFPLVLAVVLGFAFSKQKLDPTRIGILPGPERSAWQERLARDPEVQVTLVDDEPSARNKLRKGALDGLIRPNAVPEIRYDAVRPEGRMAELRVERVLNQGAPTKDAALAESRLQEITASEIGSRYIDYLFPGLLGMNLMGSGIWGIAFGLVDTRQKKLLKRLLVTPMPRSTFLASFVLARLASLVVEMTVLGLFGRYVLGVPFSGSLLALAGVCLISALGFSGLGLLVASRVRSIEAVSGITNAVMMPMWLGSGVFFSYERFPEILHPVLRLLPLTAVNDALRMIFLDGAGFTQILSQLAVVTGWGLLSFFAALRIFRWD